MNYMESLQHMKWEHNKKIHPKRRKPSRSPRRQRKTTKSQNIAHALVVVKTQMMKKKPTLWESWNEELASSKVSFPSNVLIVAKLVILLTNAVMQKVQKVIKNKKLLRKKRNIRKDIKANFWKRKISILKKIVPHPMKMIVTMNQEKCCSWHLKKILKIMKINMNKKEKWTFKKS